MNFGYQDNTLYLYFATEGHKIDILKENISICFKMVIKTYMVTSESPCNWGMKYLSLIGRGKTYLMDRLSEKIDGSNIFL